MNRLYEKGRATYSELAEELMLTVPTVQARIDKLIKIGVIDHFGIYLNPHTLTGDLSAILHFQVMKDDVQSFVDHLQSLDEIKSSYKVLYTYNLLIITQFQPITMIQMLF